MGFSSDEVARTSETNKKYREKKTDLYLYGKTILEATIRKSIHTETIEKRSSSVFDRLQFLRDRWTARVNENGFVWMEKF